MIMRVSHQSVVIPTEQVKCDTEVFVSQREIIKRSKKPTTEIRLLFQLVNVFEETGACLEQSTGTPFLLPDGKMMPESYFT